MTDTATKSAIVVGVDGSQSSTDAVRWAARECARHKAPLRLVHGYFLPAPANREEILETPEIRRAFQEQARRWLVEAEEAALAVAPGIAVDTDLRMDGPIPTLIAESAHARLVVLGSRGLGGFSGLLVGSTSSALAAHGHSPVVVVRGPAFEEGPVVVGVDGSPASEAAIAFAFETASTHGASLTAMLAWSDFLVDSMYHTAPSALDWDAIGKDYERLLAERLAGWQEKYPDVAVERVVVRDRPAHALLRLAETARLVVVGSRGRGGFAGMLLGSTSQALVHHCPCPVAVVRNPEAGRRT